MMGMPIIPQQQLTGATPKVYAAIAKVTAALAKEGIGKDRKNEQQGYKFRGIDDVYNALSSHLASAGLCIIPHYADREVVERTSAKGGALFYVTVAGTYDIVCAEDGSVHTAGPFYGEAMDSGDKATNKAMSAAYKYLAMQLFSIPTEGDNDADATTHEVAPSGRLTDKEYADFMASMDGSATAEDLQRAHTKAVLAARHAGDERSEQSFTRHKDQLKAKLRQPA
jgi:hypothetical protein